MKITLILLILLAVSFPLAAGGGDTVVNGSVAVLTVDDTVRNITGEIWYSADGSPMQFIETDTRFNLTVDNQNKNFFSLRADNTGGNNQDSEYKILYCSISEISDYDRFSYNQENRCPDGWFAYKLRDIREGRTIIVKKPPEIEINNVTHSGFYFYVGGDDRGFNAAGGGGGLPVCESLTISWTESTHANWTTGGEFVFGNHSQFNWDIWFTGSTYTGCSVTDWSAQDYSTTRTLYWRSFPRDISNAWDFWYNETNSTSNELFSSCHSSSVGLGSSGSCFFANFHINDTCLHNKTIRTRARVTGTVLGTTRTYYSPQRTYKVHNPFYDELICNPVVEEEGVVWFMFAPFMMAGAYLVYRGSKKNERVK